VDFISKPVNPPVVLARVKTHLALKRQGDELRRLSRVDGLTGLANRRTFDDTLEQEWRRARRNGEPLSLLMVDVDYFKRYNDAYGHPAGDDCLRRVAGVLADGAQRAGDLAARYGGEEFALILSRTRPADGRRIAKRLCAGVQQLEIPHADSPAAPQVTVSIGIAGGLAPCAQALQPGHSCRRCAGLVACLARTGELVAAADQALFGAKAAGRNRTRLAVLPPPADPVGAAESDS
jgi:diguanylate cyclase (GGDEF)-like protein